MHIFPLGEKEVDLRNFCKNGKVIISMRPYRMDDYCMIFTFGIIGDDIRFFECESDE
jgi:hypothetical protein